MSRESIISIAASQNGVAEIPANSNRTQYGEWYGLNGAKWCAIFVSWVYSKAGNPLEAVDTAKGYQSCQSGYNFWKRKNRLTKTPQPGDIVLFDWGGDGVCDHTGIFVGWNNEEHTLFSSWEGNTGFGDDSNGGVVMLRKRARSLVKAFVSPGALNDDTGLIANDDNLEKGDRGSGVTFVQKMLFKLGYSVTIDGDFGSNTEALIKLFQNQHGLQQTGIVTPELKGFMQEEAALATIGKDKATTGSYIHKGDAGSAVLAVQNALIARYADTPIKADGMFGDNTFAGVKIFQEENGLVVDGIVGPATLSALGIHSI
jgi:peptidoglycan hydrolase-like protein with peptidoglycan-binding domain